MDVSFPFFELSLASLLAKLRRNPRKRLCGVWKGNFEPTPNIDRKRLSTELHLGESRDDNIHAIIYYEGTRNGETIYKGVDEIVDGRDKWIDSKDRRWTPKFTNKIHVVLHKTPTNLDHQPPDDYLWTCTIDASWRHMDVIVTKIGHADITFTGHLTKI